MLDAALDPNSIDVSTSCGQMVQVVVKKFQLCQIRGMCLDT